MSEEKGSNETAEETGIDNHIQIPEEVTGVTDDSGNEEIDIPLRDDEPQEDQKDKPIPEPRIDNNDIIEDQTAVDGDAPSYDHKSAQDRVRQSGMLSDIHDHLVFADPIAMTPEDRAKVEVIGKKAQALREAMVELLPDCEHKPQFIGLLDVLTLAIPDAVLGQEPAEKERPYGEEIEGNRVASIDAKQE